MRRHVRLSAHRRVRLTSLTTTERWVLQALRTAPPIVHAAIIHLLDHEQRRDPIGYDISYYQEDLPRVVADAIKPWADL